MNNLELLAELFIPSSTLGIKRESMPQVKKEDIPNYLNWMHQHRHITSIRMDLPVNRLKFAQKDYNRLKVQSLLTQDRAKLRDPVIVSEDNFILDGNHRVLALLNMEPFDTIPVYKMSADFPTLMAATKEYPKAFSKTVVESFRSLTEAIEKHSVLTFGRMNPPTAGHAKLVHKVHEVAQEHHADHHVILSHSQDTEKNPLSTADKLKHAKHAFPGTHVTASSPKHPTIFHHAALLHKAGTKHLHVVVGSDRVKEFHDSLHKYNGHFDKEGHGYKFKSITVHSAGHRDPDAKGVEGMSASKMREHATKGNFHEFKKGVAPSVSKEHARELYHDVRKGQGLHESVTHPSPLSLKWATIKTKSAPIPSKDEQHRKYDQEERDSHVQKEEYLMEGVHDQGIFKAVFLAGGPGSGKDFVMHKSLDGHGMVEINSDVALEYMMDKKLDKKMPDSEKDQRDAVRARAKSVTDLRHRLALHGKNGMIINSTGDDKTKIKKLKGMLEDEGYDTKLVFVHASDKVSADRNIARGQRGGRMVPEKIRAAKWQKSQDQRVDYAKMFGTDHYHEYDNSEDHKTAPPEVVQQKEEELADLHKTIKKFTQAPPAHPAAQQWIAKSLGNLINQPKMATKLIKDAPPKFTGPKMKPVKSNPDPNSEASEEARAKGLEYYGFGKYGKGGQVTHFSLHGKLQQREAPPTPEEKKRAAETAKAKTTTPPRKKAVNEAFEAFLMEAVDGPAGTFEKAKELGHTGTQMHLDTLYKKRDALPKEHHAEWNKDIRKFEAAKLHLAPPPPPVVAPVKKSLSEMMDTLRGIPTQYVEEFDEPDDRT